MFAPGNPDVAFIKTKLLILLDCPTKDYEVFVDGERENGTDKITRAEMIFEETIKAEGGATEILQKEPKESSKKTKRRFQ